MPHSELDPRLGAEVFEVPVLAPAEESVKENVDGIQGVVRGLLQEAVDYYEENLEPDQTQATDYYFGRRFGNEKKGRSSVVSTDVRDSVLDRMPELLEIFTGSDSVVEFKPRGEEDVALASQQTDYVNYVFFEDNAGFLILNAVFKDGDVRRLGYTKWWWEERDRVRGEQMDALTESDLIVLEQEDGVEFEILDRYVDDIPATDPQTGELAFQPTELFDIEVTRISPDGRLRVAAIPPEEIVWTPDSRDIDAAQLVAHVRETTKDELMGLDIDEELIDKNLGRKERTGDQSLPWARQFYNAGSSISVSRNDSTASDETQQTVVFAEAYVLLAPQKDENTEEYRPAELRMFQCVGPDYEIANGLGELVDEVPIAVFTPDPEPHTIPGLCTWDYTKSIQEVKSQIQRAQLNSLAQAVDPQIAVNDRLVNIGDLLNPEVSGIVRVRGDVNSSLREIKTTFVGAETLSVLEYYDTLKADRTGGLAAENLPSNVLQSTTPEAASAALSRSQRRIKMTARVYAETGMKKMFKGMLRELVQHKGEWAGRVVRLRGEFVDVDPRDWDADMDVGVNVGLGTGSRTEKIVALERMAEKQEAHLAQGSPLVSFKELRNTYGELTDLLGHKDTTEFWRPWGDEQQQQLEQQQAEAAQNQPPDPAQALVEIEMMKVQAQVALDQQKFEFEAVKAQREDDFKRDELARKSVLKEHEIEAQYNVKIADLQLKAQIQADRKAQEE